jgi:hypothetical protein
VGATDATDATVDTGTDDRNNDAHGSALHPVDGSPFWLEARIRPTGLVTL